MLYYTIRLSTFLFFFCNDTTPTEIYTLSLHDALPIWNVSTLCTRNRGRSDQWPVISDQSSVQKTNSEDRKSTRLNSSHGSISYAVFCLKKKKKKRQRRTGRKKENENQARECA